MQIKETGTDFSHQHGGTRPGPGCFQLARVQGNLAVAGLYTPLVGKTPDLQELHLPAGILVVLAVVNASRYRKVRASCKNYGSGALRVPKSRKGNPCFFLEEAAKVQGLLKSQLIGNLLDAEFGVQQQPFGLQQQPVLDDGFGWFAGQAFNRLAQVLGGNVNFVRIITDFVPPSVLRCHQAVKVPKDANAWVVFIQLMGV